MPRLFQCLLVSFRPLRLEELAEVLAIRFDSDTTADLVTGWRPEDTEDAILSACSNLIAVVESDGSPIVQFAHFSVKEYLTSNRLTMARASLSRYHIPAEPAYSPAHLILAQACLSTLLELDEHINKERLENYPLVFYAAQHWVDHAQIGDISLSILDRMEQLFDADKPHFSAWIWSYDVNYPWRTTPMEDISERPSGPVAAPLYYSAACGLRSLVERLVATHPKDVNPREGSIWASLRVAIEKRQLDVARLLLEHGACADIKDTNGWTLLHEASYGWDIGALQLLLEHGADVDRRNSRDQTLLHLESLEAIQLLLAYSCCWHTART
jgi:ankyrin repeat protein